jgi:valyl-tRNA synthetase
MNKNKKPIDFTETETKWQTYWEKEKIYTFNQNDQTRPVYTIDTPPPTVSGKMHLGHAFSYAQQDFIARYKRMQGFNVFYPFGTDDNGLATERMIEKTKNVKSTKMQRKDFVKLCEETLIDLRKEYLADWKKIGMSCDFNLFYTTIDKHCQKISQESFIELYEKKRIERKESPIMICPNCCTAIAQVELKDQQKEATLYYIKAKTENKKEITFATTRPELLPACMGISVNPNDKRYTHLIGKKIILPITKKEITLSADEKINPEYGTGIVYMCSYGGTEDIEWLTRHPEAKPIHAMKINGKFNSLAGKYEGMNSSEARKTIIEDLEKENALEKTQKITHTLNTHERCDTPIEFVATKQWFIRYLNLKKEFLTRGNEMKWHPAHMKNRYDNWIKGLKWDWCISRQRHFGIPFPLWYCKKCNQPIIADKKKLPIDPFYDKPQKPCTCGSTEYEPEKDVMDTWATSSLTPQITTALTKHPQVKIPYDLRPQAHDIITFWLFNTMAKAHLHQNTIPFKNIMISGWALDPRGKKMSKSKGNIIHPQELMQKYSADILRFWAAGSTLGEDNPIQEKDLITGKKFILKLKNATEFTANHTKQKKINENPQTQLKPTDKWILSRLTKTIEETTKALENHEYSKAFTTAKNFFLTEYADYYIEETKHRVYNEKDPSQNTALYCLKKNTTTLLKLFAPILPHITEELMQTHFKKEMKTKSIHTEEWPKPEKKWISKEAEQKGKTINETITIIRKHKTENNLSMNTELQKITLTIPKEKKEHLKKDTITEIQKIMNIKKMIVEEGKELKAL